MIRRTIIGFIALLAALGVAASVNAAQLKYLDLFRNLALSPDGQHLYFSYVDKFPGQSVIGRLDLATLDLRVYVPPCKAGWDHPRVSPDGRRVVLGERRYGWVSDDDPMSIVLLDPVSGAYRYLTEPDPVRLIWRPTFLDDTTVAFVYDHPEMLFSTIATVQFGDDTAPIPAQDFSVFPNINFSNISHIEPRGEEGVLFVASGARTKLFYDDLIRNSPLNYNNATEYLYRYGIDNNFIISEFINEIVMNDDISDVFYRSRGIYAIHPGPSKDIIYLVLRSPRTKTNRKLTHDVFEYDFITRKFSLFKNIGRWIMDISFLTGAEDYVLSYTTREPGPISRGKLSYFKNGTELHLERDVIQKIEAQVASQPCE